MTDRGFFDLSGKVALVTGAGHGLGREFCLGVAEYGANVVCNDIDPQLAQDTIELTKKYGHPAIAVPADVSKQEEIENLVKRAVDEFGTIDILFCNAGIPTYPHRLHELAVEDWDRVMNLNVRGTFLLMHSVLPVMLKQKKGSIILTASVAGIMAGAEVRSMPAIAYGASKHAVIGIMRHAAVTYAKDGIRINAIAPGAHSTRPLQSKRNMEEIEKWIAGFIPLGRVGNPSEIRGLAIYLASDASSYVTGQIFVHDGGFTT